MKRLVSRSKKNGLRIRPYIDSKIGNLGIIELVSDDESQLNQESYG